MSKRNFDSRLSIVDTENDNSSDVSDVCPEDLVNMVKVSYVCIDYLGYIYNVFNSIKIS